MEIRINQRKISIGDKYNIFVDGQESYFASAKLFRWLSEINLFRKSDEHPRCNLKKRWAWFNTSYDLTRWDNTVFEFRTKSFWRLHFYCAAGPEYYEIFGHRGRKYSVYKNDRQIAWWCKNTVALFEGDHYKIVADRDCDVELIISFCLIIDNSHSNSKDGKAIHINLGHIGPQARAFDTSWSPRY